MAGTRLLSCTKHDAEPGELRVPNGGRFSSTLRVINTGSRTLAVGTVADALIPVAPLGRCDVIVAPGQDLIIDVVGPDRSGAAVHIATIEDL